MDNDFNLKHNKVLHTRNILLTIVTEEVPHVPDAERVTVEQLPAGFQRVVGRYGFMEEPNIPKLLALAPIGGGAIELPKTTFFLSRETVIASRRTDTMMGWRKRLFSLMSRNATSATAYFGLTANRVVELGSRIEI